MAWFSASSRSHRSSSVFTAYQIIGPSNQLAIQVPVAVALLCAPVVFIPMHYVTQGYLTAASNIVAIWIFQAPVNIVAAIVARDYAQRSLVTR